MIYFKREKKSLQIALKFKDEKTNSSPTFKVTAQEVARYHMSQEE